VAAAAISFVHQLLKEYLSALSPQLPDTEYQDMASGFYNRAAMAGLIMQIMRILSLL
jgi:hypothetical protein